MVQLVEKDAKVTMWLADYAQVSPDGKLHCVGAGWTVIGPDPMPYFIALLVEMPWNAAGVRHTAKLELIDNDGNAVTVQTPEGDLAAVQIVGQFEMAPSPGVRRGTPLQVPAAIPVPPYEIAPDGRYEWRLEIDGQTDEDWRIGFGTRPAAQSNFG